jgi:tripartite-type tricarboxylate transporter receptor subunit TctC
MKLSRRAFLGLAAGVAALPVLPRIAGAEAYPSRPVRIVVGLAPGSAGDIIARLIGPWLSVRLGQPFVIENRGGAGGTLAAEMVVRAQPDGYTLLLSGSSDAVTATLYEKLSYNFIRDTAPVASIASGPLVLVVHPSFPAKTIAEFIAYAKANPGKVDFASAGIGTVAHMAGELFMTLAGVNLVHVPYRGLGPAMTDLLGGQVQTIFSTMPPVIGHVKAGRLRALGVTSKSRYEALPDLPPIGDVLQGYEASITVGLCAPKNTPAKIVERLHTETSAALDDPEFKSRLAALGSVPLSMSTADFGRFIAAETEKWAKVIRATNIKAN